MSDKTPSRPKEVERPLGAAENGTAFLDRIEHNYDFSCEGGELKNCAEWHEARLCFEVLADFARHAALSPESPARETVAAGYQRWNKARATERDGGDGEAYEIGKRDGYEQAVQDIDLLTGGCGEFYVSTAGDDCPDVATMKARISDRFAALTPRHEAPAETFTISRAEYETLKAGYPGDPSLLHEAPAEGAGRADVLATMRDHYQFALTGPWPDIKTPNYALAGLFKMAGDEIERLRARSSAPEAREGEAS